MDNWIGNALIFCPCVSVQKLITAIQTKQAWRHIDSHLVIAVISIINYPALSIMLNKNICIPPIQMCPADTYIKLDSP